MTFEPLAVDGAYRVETVRHEDDRGYFARAWCEREFREAGIDIDRIVQSSLSFNKQKGTLRGLHYQSHPFEETKIVRAIRGRAADVVLDLRPDSPTYLKNDIVEISSDNHTAVVIPGGCAHGFVTLADDTEILYMMDQFYEPSAARGVRWNDPAFGIIWPVPVNVINERDASYPDYNVDSV